jgi:hypothetical protein
MRAHGQNDATGCFSLNQGLDGDQANHDLAATAGENFWFPV